MFLFNLEILSEIDVSHSRMNSTNSLSSSLTSNAFLAWNTLSFCCIKEFDIPQFFYLLHDFFRNWLLLVLRLWLSICLLLWLRFVWFFAFVIFFFFYGFNTALILFLTDRVVQGLKREVLARCLSRDNLLTIEAFLNLLLILVLSIFLFNYVAVPLTSLILLVFFRIFF